jgi:arylsulfatase A-like enzyme
MVSPNHAVHRLFACIALSLSVVGVNLQASEVRGGGAQPNIVLIMADDLGYSDLGCYGGEIATPHLDRLSAEGVRFTQAYNMAKCEPTRNSMIAGQRNTPRIGFFVERSEIWLPELLRDLGYSTILAGKWHVSGHPLDRGFDKFFGHEEGASNYFTGSGRLQLGREKYAVPDGFYSTDGFTDFAIQFVDEARKEGQPFFLYLAYTAPHDPLQAPGEDIDRYREKYAAGWEEIQRQRFARLKELGIIPADAKQPDWPQNLPRWDELTPGQKKMEELRMETYAAMVDRMDQNIGRLLAHLDEIGVADNTIVLFLSDNGANPFDRGADRMVKAGILPGGPDSDWSTGPAWAHVSNTPFRMYKRNKHEGGICTPLILHGPAHGYPAGSLSSLPVHILDFMPTFLGWAGAGEIPPQAEGTDLSKALAAGGQTRGDFRIVDYLVDHRCIRRDNWKLVSVDGEPWELYDLSQDRTETNDLAASAPDKASELEAEWNADWQSFSQKSFLSEERTNPRLRMGDRGSGVRYKPVEVPVSRQ